MVRWVALSLTSESKLMIAHLSFLFAEHFCRTGYEGNGYGWPSNHSPSYRNGSKVRGP